MVSTEIIKNWGGQNGEAENNFGGAFAPPLAPPPGTATDSETFYGLKFSISGKACLMTEVIAMGMSFTVEKKQACCNFDMF